MLIKNNFGVKFCIIKEKIVIFTPQIQAPTTSGRIRPKPVNDLMSKEIDTDPIEHDEPENLVVDLDPAQLLLGMFDDAPKPIPFDASNNTVIIEYTIVRDVDV